MSITMLNMKACCMLFCILIILHNNKAIRSLSPGGYCRFFFQAIKLSIPEDWNYRLLSIFANR